MSRRNQSLYGKKILITGAGSGIGALTAEALAAEGANLYLSDVNYQAVEEVATKLPQYREVLDLVLEVSQIS